MTVKNPVRPLLGVRQSSPWDIVANVELFSSVVAAVATAIDTPGWRR